MANNQKGHNRILILIGTMITQMGLGTIYTWSLFNQPLAEKFGWELSSVSITFSITSFALAFSTLFAGKIQEKIGIRKLITFAGIALGGGLILSSTVKSIGLLYITAGVIVGAADGIAYMTSLSNCIKWFPERKGLISGFCVGSYGIGSLIFKYINAGFISSKGVSFAFLAWGIIALILIVAGGQLIKAAPEVETSINTALVQKQYTQKEMLKTKESYLLFIMIFTACMVGLYLIGVVKDIGVNMVGLDAATAANAVAMVAIFNTAGRLILGSLSDKVGGLKVVTFAFAVTAISILVLAIVPLNFEIFFTCVAAIAFCFGGNITVFPTIAGEFFGLKNHSKNYGIIYQGFGIGALSGAFIANMIGSFKGTFIVMGVMCLISMIITILIKAPTDRKVRSRELRLKTA